MDFGLWKSATNKNYIKQIVDSPSNSSEKKKSKSSSNNLACWKVNKEDECQNENAHIAYIPEEGNVPIVPKVENETSSLKIGNEEKSDCARKSSIPSKIFAVRLSIVSSYKYWIHSEYALPRSYYVSMFFFEFICFLIIAFGYKSFQPKEDDFTDVKSIFTKNRIPWIFTFMLLTQFLFMIIDRIIYLKKSVQSKLVFHVIVVSIIHFWLFFYMEKITGQYFWHNSAAKMFYFFKCIYFYISCCQIRSKYPIRVIGHFLTKNYNYVTLYLYVIYRAIPFLTEIRNVMDWICTDTTLTISHWFILEDVHSLLFKTKCWRRYELEYCELRGIAKGKFTKWGQGLFFLLGMIIIIWLPLIIFSLPNNVYQPNPPIKCKIDIRIGEIQSIYTMESLSNDVINSRNINYNEIKSNKISKFRSSDITYMRMNPFSLSYCDVTPPMLKYLTDIFNSRNDTNINVIMHFYRKSGPILSDEIISNVFNTTLKYDSKERKLFQSMLQFISNSNSMSNSTIEPVTLINLIPNRLILPSKLNPIDLKLGNFSFQ
ncbi:hypothetical protein A3Q56_08034 [Intoshia linei]|uniref:Piezo THU9 and anchor domain-containing protein n=1 Tax=Intoshia linei TaxID=1819745 RepID=A0A177AQG0_9BILA|nr:hypothetical protein A3Q56_08034 [Intoshia linei]